MAHVRVRELKDGRKAYLVRYRGPDGVERSKQFARRRDADRFINLIEIDLVTSSWVDPRLGRITVTEWFGRWWPTTATDLKASTRARDEATFRTHIQPVFGTTPLGKLDRTRIRQWVTDLTASGLAPATVVKAVQVFNKLVRAAVDDRVIAHNPVEKVPLPRIHRDEMRFLTASELWTLADTIDPRYRSLVLLGGYSGLRIGEMLALRWNRINPHTGTVTVAETMTDLAGHISYGPPKTKAANRTVTIPDVVTESLYDMNPSPTPDELVFQSPEHHPLRLSSFRRRTWTPAVESASLAPLRIHDLRHTAISLWIAAGAHPKQIANRAGHTSVAIVLDRYGHLYPQHDNDLINALQDTGRASKSVVAAIA